MSAISFTEEFTSPVPAAKLFKGLILDAPTLFPKLFPQHVKSIETIEGNGGPGSITKMTLLEGDEVKYAKHRIDELDKEKMTYSYSVIEGEVLEKFETIGFELKFEASGDGGCKGTNTGKYVQKAGVEIKEEEIEAGKKKAMALFKAVEAYLLANPQANQVLEL